MTTTVSRQEFDNALTELATQEDALQRQFDAVAASRRELPVVRIDTDYRFQSVDGEKSLADLFNGQTYLVLYHFMYAPDWEKGCPDCTSYAKGQGDPSMLHEMDTEFALVSRAPIEKLEAWKAEQGFRLPWYSCTDEFALEFKSLGDDGDFPSMTAWMKDDDGTVYLTYQTNGNPIATTIGQHGVMEMTRRGGNLPG